MSTFTHSLLIVTLLAASPLMAQENQMPNPGFDTDISGWDLSNTEAEWDGTDRVQSANSGSMRIWNRGNQGGTMAGPSVCFSVEPGMEVEAGAWALVPATERDGIRVLIGFAQFESEDCDGEPLSFFWNPSRPERGEWEDVLKRERIGRNTRSLLVNVNAFVSDQSSGDVTALIDDTWFHVRSEGHFVIDPSVSASWFNPDESGHGVMINMLSATEAWFCWYAFDPEGQPTWICGQGIATANTLFFSNTFTVTGGFFPPEFDPDMVEYEDWGTLWIEFFSCREGHMFWLPDAPGYTDGGMPLRRIAPLWGVPCEAEAQAD